MIGFDEILAADQALFLYLHQIQSEWVDPIMQILSHRLIWIPLYLFIIFQIIHKKGIRGIRIILLIIFTVTMVDLACAEVLKPGFQRLRPCHDLEIKDVVQVLGACGGKYSFPSAHAANTMALALSVFWFSNRKFGIVLTLWSIAVGYSRIYLGVHYPLDVVGGFLLGALIAYLVFRVSSNLLKAD